MELETLFLNGIQSLVEEPHGFVKASPTIFKPNKQSRRSSRYTSQLEANAESSCPIST